MFLLSVDDLSLQDLYMTELSHGGVSPPLAPTDDHKHFQAM